jgi:hypothetical protein
MTNLQAFLLGIMVAWTPGLLVLFYALTAGRRPSSKKPESPVEGQGQKTLTTQSTPRKGYFWLQG